MRFLKHNFLLVLLIILMLFIVGSFVGPMNIKVTPLSVLWGTALTTFGSVLLCALPAYVMAAALAGILKLSPKSKRFYSRIFHVLSGLPSIVFGIIGFTVFCQMLNLGWSILSAILTLSLMIFPVLVTGFLQFLEASHNEFSSYCKSLRITPLEFLFVFLPKIQLKNFLSVFAVGWGRASSDTAAVMLTCGAVLEMPSSLMDPVRTLGYHIYLLGMETPGGMPEARALCFVAICILIVVQFVPNFLMNLRGES